MEQKPLMILEQNIKNNTRYGVGEYAKLLAPDLTNTDRIIVIDSGDIIVKKDLVEFYNMDLLDKLLLLL